MRKWIVGAALAGLWSLGTQAQVVTVYQQNFEVPATTACNTWGGSGGGSPPGGTFATDYNGTGQVGTATYSQIETADRFCWNTGTPGNPDSGNGGRFSGGFARNGATTESWAAAFDPQGRTHLNGVIDLAHVTPGNLNGTGSPTNYPGTAASVGMHLRFFRLPAGSTYTLQAAGAGVPANMLIGGTAQTPLPESGVVTVTKAATFTRYQPDWQTHSFSVDTSAFAAGDQLVIVGTVRDNLTYVVFDNLTITAADAPPQAPTISKRFGATQVNAGQTTSLTINITGNNVNALPGLSITDNLPAPLVLTGAGTSNTCGGTLSASAGTPQLALMGGTLPAAGCQIVAQVQWPATPAATALCTGAPVTNTIAGGTDFTLTGIDTSGASANATLACAAAPVAVPTMGLGSLLLTAFGLGSLGALQARRRRRAAAKR